VIRFENVSKVYARGARPALDRVDVEVLRGEFVFLVGASGSGKSTFLRLALREERPTRGKVYIAGRDLSRLANWKVPSLRRNIGMVFQDFRLLPNKTVYENVAFALEVIGKRRRQIKTTVPEVLDLVGLAGTEKRRPHELSGGEQQRVAIARAFVNRPGLLLCDEPTGNLDPTTSLEIMRLLEQINQTGTTVVMATHDRGIVDEMRKRVVALAGGKVMRDEVGGAYVELSPEPDRRGSEPVVEPLARRRASALPNPVVEPKVAPEIPPTVPARTATGSTPRPTRAELRAATAPTAIVIPPERVTSGAIDEPQEPTASESAIDHSPSTGCQYAAPVPFEATPRGPEENTGPLEASVENKEAQL